MPNILITGANRGIGLALVEEYLTANRRDASTPPAAIPRPPTALSVLAHANPERLRILQLDVDDEASIARAVSAIADETGSLDILINNAGISGSDSGRTHGKAHVSRGRCSYHHQRGRAFDRDAGLP